MTRAGTRAQPRVPPPAQPAPQLTLKAIVLSIVLTVILASANAYVGLFAGLTVATAIPAAVISMAVLPLFGRSNILENNIVATGASAGTSISAGAIFTLPALILLHHWVRFDYWWTLAIVGLGGLLGVLFSVPLRRTLIIEQKLKFPEGVAAAEVLKVGANPGIGAKISRRRHRRRRPVQARHLRPAAAARDLHRAGLHRRARHCILQLFVLAGVARRRLHRRAQCRDLDRGRRPIFLVGGHPGVQQLLLQSRSRIASEAGRPRSRGRGVRHLARAGALHRRRLHVDRRALGAVVPAQIPVVGGSQRTQGEREVPRPSCRTPSAICRWAAVLLCIALFVVPLFVLYYLVVGSLGVALRWRSS